jgi:carboxymethylenebutenolidase
MLKNGSKPQQEAGIEPAVPTLSEGQTRSRGKYRERFPDLGAAVSFYSRQPSAEDVAQIKTPLLVHYGSLDTRVTGGWPTYEAALKANHVTYTAYVYERANHAFHNDTIRRYDEAAAKLAWQRTVDFLNKYLRS